MAGRTSAWTGTGCAEHWRHQSQRSLENLIKTRAIFKRYTGLRCSRKKHITGLSIITESTHTSSLCSTEDTFLFSCCFYWCFCLLCKFNRATLHLKMCTTILHYCWAKSGFHSHGFIGTSVYYWRWCHRPTGTGSDSGTKAFIAWKWQIGESFINWCRLFKWFFSYPGTSVTVHIKSQKALRDFSSISYIWTISVYSSLVWSTQEGICKCVFTIRIYFFELWSLAGWNICSISFGRAENERLDLLGYKSGHSINRVFSRLLHGERPVLLLVMVLTRWEYSYCVDTVSKLAKL